MKTIKKKLNIVLLGPPGAGKGTQAQILIEKFKLKLISTGDFSRKVAQEKSPRGKLARESLASGKLVPNKIIDDYVEEEMKKVPLKKEVIFDGFPRDLPQAKFLENLMKKLKREFQVLYIELTPKEAIRRLSSRKICSKCNLVFKLEDLNNKNQCPKCKSELTKRFDDNSEIVRKRFKEYLSRTKPVINFFKTRSQLIKINGEQSISCVAKDILIKINN